ncbi:MAG: GH36-type glycosyl hydrolase domain-containing protein [Planctomycetota bacterium]
MSYGRFEDDNQEYVITDPLPPHSWINYLGNRRLTAFISQNAGGMLWYRDPQTRRISRYHYRAGPGDRPGFYVYLQDRGTGEFWNPHFAPVCAELDSYECRHSPGISRFVAFRDDLRAELTYLIPPSDDVMLCTVSLNNRGAERAELEVVSYLEFGLLEYMREVAAWCYLKNHTSFDFDERLEAIRYDYHVFEAPHTPRMLFGCTEPVSGYECSRRAFIGRSGTLRRPHALCEGGGLSGSELPIGGHGCGVLGREVNLDPGEGKRFSYVFAVGETWDEAEKLLARYRRDGRADEAFDNTRETWRRRLGRFRMESADGQVDRFVNIWNPYDSLMTLELCRSTSTDHVGLDGLRYRDTSQDALGAVTVDPDFALRRTKQVLAVQREDGAGCFAFWPQTPNEPSDEPRRSDNTVWPVYTVKKLMAETGRPEILGETVSYRSGRSEGSVYDHLLRGLRYIWRNRGPHGLPVLMHADWNDGLALWEDEEAESVMLGMQLLRALQDFRDLCLYADHTADLAWCGRAIEELEDILNSGEVWDGDWYRRLLLSDGGVLGSADCAEGKIYLNPQSWAVICGLRHPDRRVERAMDAVAERLDTECGLSILAPPYTGIPRPEDPLPGSNPGVGENGGIFCHANTWAIIAECLLGNAGRAFKYYSQLLPENVSATAGPEHYGREPYVYVSSIVGPGSERFGEGGISWLTGTAGWMYVAVTQYILGIRPELEGLRIDPCLPEQIREVRISREFRDCRYGIEVYNTGGDRARVEVDGRACEDTLIPPGDKDECRVVCEMV